MAKQHKQPTADERGDAVGDNELEEVVTNRPGADHHRASNASKKSADRDHTHAVLLEHPLDLLDALARDVFSDQGNARDLHPKAAAQVIEHAIPADDPAPGADAGPEPGHGTLGNQRAGDDER